MQRLDVTASFAPPPPARRAAHIAFMAVLAVVGWGVLLTASYLPGFGPGIIRPEGVLPVISFFVVFLVTRRMATPMLPQVVVSLDSGFYVAAAVCLGSVNAGRLVGLALMLDALVRLMAGDRRERRRSGATWTDDILYLLYFSGMTGALLMTIGWLFGVDGYSFVARVDNEWVVMRLVMGVGLTFLVAHYAISGLRLTLLGSSWRGYLRRMALPGALAEASLLPLAVVVVLIYRPDHPLGFLLLAATYLLLNLVFNRLRRTGYSLRRRVKELEALNATSRELAASLQLHELVESLSRETSRALPEAEWLTLIHRAGGEESGVERLIVDSYDCERRKFERFHVDRGTGPGGWVLANGVPLNIRDLRASDFDAGADVRSWLGVPLSVHGETAGVLAVQSRERGVFDENDQRLLESIGAQAAVALQNSRLYELAMVDGLTKLFVRRYFDARLDEEVQRSRRFGTVFAVVMMDIDDFKQLNDTYGHQAGDAVLISVAEIVRREMRGVDTAARYGGEEFAMVLPRTSMLDAYNQADRIRRMIEQQRVNIGDETLGVTASFGIAAYPESGEGGADDIVRRADTALYRAKQTGKNRVELYWVEGNEGGKPSVRPV